MATGPATARRAEGEARVAGLNQYCTLFDSNYLPRALALYRSLERSCGEFFLRAVCMDEESRRLLTNLALPRMDVIDIAEVEDFDPGLHAVRGARSATEYCWTATPSVCRFVLDAEPDLAAITYLDADLHFSSSPAPLFAELDGGSILLVPHRHERAEEIASGIYNVGWITFRNDERGRVALEWWRERCLEWCFDRLEPGRYGDQKYLDDWPARFPGVRVTQNPGAGLAPWNEGLHRVTEREDGAVRVDGAPMIFQHHAGLRMHPTDRLARLLARRTRAYRLAEGPVPVVWTALGRRRSPEMLDLLWARYVQHVAEAVAELRRAGAGPMTGLRPIALHGAAAQVVRQWPVERILRVYDRLPLVIRHRIARAVSPM